MHELLNYLVDHKRDRPLIVGINGIDASGKTVFTDHLANELEQLDHRVQIIHLDDFHLPRAQRNACTASPPICYYRHTFDWHSFGKLIADARAGLKSQTIRTLDLVTDCYSNERHFVLTPETFVLVEGVFLFQPTMLPWYDVKIYLQISENTCLARVVERDGYLFGDRQAIIDRYQQKYLPGQALYHAEAQPDKHADIVIDNNSPSAPVYSWRKA